MKRRSISIAMAGGSIVKVDAFISDSGALAVHRSIRWRMPYDGTCRDDGGFWKVTHIKTGMAMPCLIKLRREAMALANTIDGFDWNFHSKWSRKIPALQTCVRAAIAEHVSP